MLASVGAEGDVVGHGVLQFCYLEDMLDSKAGVERAIIIIIIIILESAVQGRERVRTLYQTKEHNPTQPTHGRKKKIKQ